METKNILITMKNGDQIKAELYTEIESNRKKIL